MYVVECVSQDIFAVLSAFLFSFYRSIAIGSTAGFGSGGHAIATAFIDTQSPR